MWQRLYTLGGSVTRYPLDEKATEHVRNALQLITLGTPAGEQVIYDVADIEMVKERLREAIRLLEA